MPGRTGGGSNSGGGSGGTTTLAINVVPASGDTTGATDLAAVNTALAAGPVKLQAGKTYYFNGLLVGTPGTCYFDSTGATLNFVTAYDDNLFQNYALANPAGTASDGAMTAGSAVVTTALGASAVVGQSITVSGAGNGGNSPLTGIVSAQTATSITIAKLGSLAANPAQLVALAAPVTIAGGAITALPVCTLTKAVSAGSITLTNGAATQTFTTSGAAAGAVSIPITSATPTANFPLDTQITATCSLSGATVTLYTRDTSIKIIGGVWNRQSPSFPGVYSRSYNLLLKHASNVVVDLEGGISTSAKSFVYFADVSWGRARLRGLNVSSGGLECEGPIWGLRVEEVQGITGDDTLAFLCANGHQSGIPYDTSGDITHVSVGIVDATSGVGLIKVIAGAGNRADQIRVSGGIFGSAAMNVAWVGDDPSGQAQMIGGAYGYIDYGLLAATPGGAAYAQLFLYDPNAEHIKATLRTRGTTPAYGVKTTKVASQPATIACLELDGDFDTSMMSVAVPVVFLNSTFLTITELRESVNYTGNASGGYVVYFNQAGAVITEHNHLAGKWYWPAAGGSGYAIYLGTGTLSRLNMNGGGIQGSAGLVRDNVAAALDISLEGGFEVIGVSTILSAHAAGTKTIKFGNCRLDGAITNVVFTGLATVLLAGGANTIYSGATITAWVARAASEVVTALPGCRLPLNLTLLSRTVGSECVDSAGSAGTAGLPVVCTTTAASGWKNQAGGSY